MQIKNVRVISHEPEFLGDGYAMSVSVQTRLHHRLIEIETQDGTTGVGEIVRPPIYDRAELERLEDELLSDLSRVTLADLPGLLAAWRGHGKKVQGFAFGVELAMLDLMGRGLGVPLASLLGGALVEHVPEYLSLSSEAPEEMAAVVARSGARFSVIQAKLGIDDLETDLRRVEAVLRQMRPDQQLLADFNGALAPEDAICGLPAISDSRVMWEEPCSDYDDGVAVARAIDHPVMFDQCLTDLPTYARALKDGAAAALVIKSDSIGGLSAGRTVRDMCAAAGMRMRIDGWWAGPVAAAGALHLAIGAPRDCLIASIDLTDPIKVDRSYRVRPAAGRIAPSPGAGLGQIPRDLFAANPASPT